MTIDDFLYKIETYWKKRIGRICRKAQKIKKVDQVQIIAEADILKFAAYIEGKYRSMMNKMNENRCVKTFDVLTHFLIVHIMLLVRRSRRF